MLSIAQWCRATQTIDPSSLNTENGQRKPNKAENGIWHPSGIYSWYRHYSPESLESTEKTGEFWSSCRAN